MINSLAGIQVSAFTGFDIISRNTVIGGLTCSDGPHTGMTVRLKESNPSRMLERLDHRLEYTLLCLHGTLPWVSVEGWYVY